MAKRPAKPRQLSALAKRRLDLEAVSLQPDAANLPMQQDIEVAREGQTREGRKVDTNLARRHNAFSALKIGMAHGAYDAARRFEMDLLTRHGCADRGRSLERVDCTAGPTTDKVIAAGQRVEDIQDRIPPRDFWLLCELIVPPIDRGTWRDHVQFICGEKHSEGQAACVRSACINLRDAYTAIERRTAA